MNYLLAISIGPVQEFIAAARRTADLQAGSALLVEIAKTVAETVAPHGALIFPANPQQDGPNKILALVKQGKPEEIARAARSAAIACLQKDWDEVKRGIPNLDGALAATQVAHFLEFYAAWYPVADDQHDYLTARTEVDRLLAGRKARREFAQPISPGQRMKSPLDPARDCVLISIDAKCHQRPFYLKKTETLDAISLLKRIRGVHNGSMPSTSEMALCSVLPELEKAAPIQLEAFKKYKRDLGPSVDLGDFFFPGRLEDMAQEEVGSALSDDDLNRIETLLHAALNKIGRDECPPYYVILVADGDKMGALLNKMTTVAEHQAFSTKLSGFAKWARSCAKDHGGIAVYTGGDDVLALLPVNRALDCAAALALEFRARLGHPIEGGTLSVGIAIVHFLDSLQVSLGHARAAEHLAKVERNSLAVALHTRGGEPIKVAEKWGATPQADGWHALVGALKSDLSRGFPYELRTLAREWHGAEIPEERRAESLRAEAERVLKRKKGGVEEVGTEVAAIFAGLRDVATSDDLEQYAKRLVIARFLADYEPKDGKDGKDGGKENV